jgi:hypothetical protein
LHLGHGKYVEYNGDVLNRGSGGGLDISDFEFTDLFVLDD